MLALGFRLFGSRNREIFEAAYQIYVAVNPSVGTLKPRATDGDWYTGR